MPGESHAVSSGSTMDAMSSRLNDKDLLARLVAFDTVSRNSNLPIVDFLSEYLERPGIEIIRQPNDDGTKANLIIWAGPKLDGDAHRFGLILSGHVDVVPPGDRDDWNSDPFVLTERDGSYFGRGACDMKGFDALAISLLAEIDPSTLKAPLVGLFTFDEELGTLGALHFSKHWPSQRPLPPHAIVGEPTSLRAVRMHKGHAAMRATVRGRPAHSGYPHLGVNAIEPAGRIIVALAELRAALEQERCETSKYFPDVPYAALNVAQVAGGEAINIVPETCTVHIGVRALPGMDSQALAARIRQAVQSAKADADVTFELLNDSPPFEVDESAPIYKAVCGLVDQRETYGVNYASDAGHLARMGVDCVLFGPGSIDVAHRPNEFIPIDEFERAKGLLRSLVQQMCVD